MKLSELLGTLLPIAFNSNQSIAARELNVSQALISRALSGKDKTDRSKLMVALTNHPRISNTWLRTGEGTPLNKETREHLPVTTFPVPDITSINPNDLLDPMRAVALDHYRPTRYWYELPPYSAANKHLGRLTQTPRLKDYLLVETDQRFIEQHIKLASLVIVKYTDADTGFAKPIWTDNELSIAPIIIDKGAPVDGLTSRQLSNLYATRFNITIPRELTSEAGKGTWRAQLRKWLEQNPINVTVAGIVGLPIIMERPLF